MTMTLSQIRQIRRMARAGLVPLAWIGGRVLRWISVLDLRRLREERTRAAHWARPDWRASLADIQAEAQMFHNEIPFSGDARAFIERGDR